MRTVLGSVALCVGGFLLLATLLTVTQWPGVALWLKLTIGCAGVVLVVAGLGLLTRKQADAGGRRAIIVLALAGGLAGLVFGLGSKNYAQGKYCGIEGHPPGYRLTVRIFGTVLHEETGPAVQHQEKGSRVTGPSQELETAMVCWELGLDAALIAAAAFAGGLLGLGLRRRTR